MDSPQKGQFKPPPHFIWTACTCATFFSPHPAALYRPSTVSRLIIHLLLEVTKALSIQNIDANTFFNLF